MFDPDSASRLILLLGTGSVGASIGSFLNVCVYRIPVGLTVTEPRRSFCPHCRHQVAAHDNIPVLSWLWLRGRCRFCKSPISIWYFLVELLCGLGAAFAFAKGGLAQAGSFLLFFSLLCVALRTRHSKYQPGTLLLIWLVCAVSLVLLQRQITIMTTPSYDPDVHRRRTVDHFALDEFWRNRLETKIGSNLCDARLRRPDLLDLSGRLPAHQ